MLLGIFFRLYQIGNMPGGLFPDEAANGLDINLMQQGHLQPFYERGNGREALFFYLLWGGVELFGRSPFAHHFVVALVGIVALWLCFLLTRLLFGLNEENEENVESIRTIRAGRKSFSEIVTNHISKANLLALLATFLMATNTWHIVLSRTAFRANLIPVFTTMTFLAMLAVVTAKTRSKQYLWSVLFGASFALGFYTYIAYRVIVPLLIILIAWPFFGAVKTQGFKEIVKRYVPLLLAAIVSFVIVIAPLAKYFYTHPGSFVGRSGQVSVFNTAINHGDLKGTILEVSRLSFLAYFTEGDLNWRHNISGMPFLSAIISPFFALGLLLVLYGAIRYLFAPNKQAKYFPEFFLAGWFASFLLPVITTAEGIPHGLRSIGTIPAVFIITAFGLYKISHLVWHVVTTYPHGSPRMEHLVQSALKLLVVCFALALPIQSYANYFIFAGNSPENFYAFRSDLTVVSEYLKQFGNRQTTYLILDTFSVQTVDYLTTVDGKYSCDRDPNYRPTECIDNPKNKPFVQIDPEDSWRPANYIKDGKNMWINGLVQGDKVVFTQSSIFDIKKFKANHPSATLEQETRNKFGQVVLAVYRIK